MSVQAIRALVLAANVLVIAVIASVAYLTFGPVDWDFWSVEAPQLSRFEPPALQQALVDAGATGRKSGRGFYLYAEGKKAGAAPDALSRLPPGPALTADG